MLFSPRSKSGGVQKCLKGRIGRGVDGLGLTPLFLNAMVINNPEKITSL